jgi:hypothetical protein
LHITGTENKREEKGVNPFSSRQLQQSVLLLFRGGFVDRRSCPY